MRLLSEVQRAGGQVLSVWPRRESLEDLFLREIGRDFYREVEEKVIEHRDGHYIVQDWMGNVTEIWWKPSLLPGALGVAGMSYRRFLSYNVVGAIAWIAELAGKDPFLSQFVRRSAHNAFLIEDGEVTTPDDRGDRFRELLRDSPPENRADR
jgi:hypothetical protein